jgi:uncharacterized delta-60 repeat protein
MLFSRMTFDRRRGATERHTLEGHQSALAETLETRALLSAGDLDPSFGDGGRVITHFGGVSFAYSVAIDTYGKIVVAGQYKDTRRDPVTNQFNWPDFALARYNPDGTADAGFGTGGVVTTDFDGSEDVASKVVVQPDGKILVAGWAIDVARAGYDFGLARYNNDGSLDQSFGSGGKVTTNFGSTSTNLGYGLTVDADGKILVAGWTASPDGASDFGLARYCPTGALDAAFGNGGKVITDFSGNDDYARGVLVQDDGRIVVGGYTGPRSGTSSRGGSFALARYETDGMLDDSFGTAGRVITPFADGAEQIRNIALLPGGKILAQGADYLAQYNSSGQLDPYFGTNGIVNTEATGHGGDRNGLFVDGSGRIVVTGTTASLTGQYFAWIIGRYTSAGALDPGFGTGGESVIQFTGYDDCYAIAGQSDGKLVAAGFAGVPTGTDDHFAVARFFADSIQPTTLAVPNSTGTYGGSTALSAQLTSNGTPLANATLRFRLNGFVVGTASTNTGGVATLSSVGLTGLHVGTYAGAVSVDFAGDASYAPRTAAGDVVVTPAAARVAYNGLMFVTSDANGNATLALRADLLDNISPSGRITDAAVSFEILDANTATSLAVIQAGSVGLLSASDVKTGSATGSWAVGIGSASSNTYRVVVHVRGDYVGQTTGDLVTVARPSNNHLIGGGYLLSSASAGAFAADAGTRTSFSFNVRDRTGTPSGSVTVLFSHTAADGLLHTYQVNGTLIQSFGADTTENRGDLLALADLYDLTSGNPALVATGLTLQIALTAGKTDTLAITLWNGNSLYFSSDWDNSLLRTVEAALGSGHLQVN